MRIHRLFTSKTKTLKHLRLCFLIFMFPNFSASGVDLGFSSTTTLGEYFTYIDRMNLIVKEATGLPDKAYVSIRIGETRRQGPYKPDEAFGSLQSFCSAFVQVGSAQNESYSDPPPRGSTRSHSPSVICELKV